MCLSMSFTVCTTSPLDSREHARRYHYDVLARVLLLFAKLNNGVKYAQGMNELCAPLYYLFSQDPLCGQHAEADTFFCFNLLMADMQDVFVENLNETGKGMLGRMEKCSQILKENDSQLWEHLNGQNVEPVLYNARWIMSMLTQDLVMPDVLRVWDTLLGNLGGPKPLLHDLCVARATGLDSCWDKMRHRLLNTSSGPALPTRPRTARTFLLSLCRRIGLV